MPVRPLLPLAASLCLFALVASPSFAEMYKWVDERGVTNYSDQPPPASVKRQAIADNRVSVYTPHRELLQAMEAERARAIDDLRTGRRGREIHEEWLARQYFASAHARSADPCAGDASCGSAYLPFSYAPVGRVVGQHGLRVLPQISLPAGTTAGNVTAGRGYIPGNSAFAPGATITAPRAVLEGARSRGHRAGGFGGGGGHRR